MDDGVEGRDRAGSGVALGGFDRRRFLGVAAAGAFSLAACGMTGCDSTADVSPGAGHGRTESERSAAGERRRSGSPDWRIRSLGPPDAIEGYADKVSVLPGEAFGLHVSTTAPGFRVSAYRIGWYGGAQARLVWRSGQVAGRHQHPPRLESGTRTVQADWERTTVVRTDGWPEGAYLLRLDAESGQRYVPMIVRSASASGATLLMHAAATWQAYNQWGGYSLYEGKDGAYGNRSLAVSFDRPYDKNGAEKFLVYERAAVVLAERLRIPLAYTTGVDVHLAPSVLRDATTVVSLGHDEYWTPEQRRYVTRARDAGTNLVFLGANSCFRRVRLEPMGTGAARRVVCYKTDYQDDPYLVDHPSMPTNDFRSPPAAQPESSMTGLLYEGYPTDAPYVVHGADHWIFAGTGVKRGTPSTTLSGWNTTASCRRRLPPGRWRSSPTPRWSARAGAATPTPRTTPCRAARASSPRGRCGG